MTDSRFKSNMFRTIACTAATDAIELLEQLDPSSYRKILGSVSALPSKQLER